MLQQQRELAEQILGRYEKLGSAVTTAVDGLQPLILDRLECERTLAQAEVQEATGEPADVEEAQAAVEAAHHELAEASRRLGSLRSAQSGLGGQLASAHAALAAELPAADAALRETFASEWNQHISAFGLVLARRAAVEKLLGQPLKLDEPTPTPAADLPPDPIPDLSQAAKPRRLLDSLKQCLAELKRAGDLRHYSPVNPPGWRSKLYDSSAIYTLTKPAGNLSAGVLVIEASFTPGELHALVEGDSATLFVDANATAGADAARAALQKIHTAEAEEQRKRDAQKVQDSPAYRAAKHPARWDEGVAPEPTSPIKEYVDKDGRRVTPGRGGVV
jgi:hypothetical protein